MPGWMAPLVYVFCVWLSAETLDYELGWGELALYAILNWVGSLMALLGPGALAVWVFQEEDLIEIFGRSSVQFIFALFSLVLLTFFEVKLNFHS